MRLIRAFRRLGVARRIIVLAVLAAGLAVLAVGASVAGAALYETYGYHPAENARTWAALTPRYGEPSACATCHATQYARWSHAKHNAVTCESCHGPLAAHAADPGGTGTVTPPAADACITCHEQVTGRPAAQPQVNVAVHYTGVSCLQCHNAHTSLAESPKQITHPLANLPTCVTCHGPDQLRQFPAGHSVADDSVCLGCHRPAQSGR